MLQTLKPFEYFEPETVAEAVQILHKHPKKAIVLAGGTDILVSMRRGQLQPQYMVYAKDIAGLDHISYDPVKGLRIGAMATHQSIANSPLIKDNFGLLATACGKVGTPQIRNMGTIGGNICKAGPSQDTPPALLALNAKVKLIGPNGERIVPLNEFFTGPFQTVRDEAELLTEVLVPPLPFPSASCYQYCTKISTVDETLVGVAVVIIADPARKKCQDIRIGLCSVAPTAIRAKRAEEMLRGKKVTEELVEQAAQTAAAEAKPRSRPDYRRKMTMILVRQSVNEAWDRLREEK